MKSVIVGTAGHIDHGKTALVKALTGTDADRLEEEKRRGITIDIGFAHLELPAANGEKLRLGFVDVPGHERFVRNMLAGIGGIDLVVLVIAADEGIMPQTREHFDICRLLAVRRGITVLNKSDAVDAETLEVVRSEVADFLRGSFLDPAHSPLVAASSLTGAGIADVKAALAKVASEATRERLDRPRPPPYRSRLHHERLRHSRHRNAGRRHDSQRRGAGSISRRQARARPRSASARRARRRSHRRPAHRAESRRRFDRRPRARHDAGNRRTPFAPPRESTPGSPCSSPPSLSKTAPVCTSTPSPMETIAEVAPLRNEAPQTRRRNVSPNSNLPSPCSSCPEIASSSANFRRS